MTTSSDNRSVWIKYKMICNVTKIIAVLMGQGILWPPGVNWTNLRTLVLDRVTLGNLFFSPFSLLSTFWELVMPREWLTGGSLLSEAGGVGVGVSDQLWSVVRTFDCYQLKDVVELGLVIPGSSDFQVLNL